MSAAARLKAVPPSDQPPFDPLAKLREPFPAHQISKLPKPTKAQTDAVKADFKKGIRCGICGSWHHPDVVHLDYVGHAALTDRLLDTDLAWSWEPVAFRDGLPAFDATGGLWIKLTVCGVSRLGYGHAAPKNGQDPGAREKEVIGDALRNAAMRFGAALDLWHKGDLHVSDDSTDEKPEAGRSPAVQEPRRAPVLVRCEAEIIMCETVEDCDDWKAKNKATLDAIDDDDTFNAIAKAWKARRAALAPPKVENRARNDFRADELEGAFQ